MRSLVLGIAVVFFCCQAALLVATLVLAASDVGAAVGRTVDFLEAHANEDRDFQAAREFREVRPSLVRVRECFYGVKFTNSVVPKILISALLPKLLPFIVEFLGIRSSIYSFPAFSVNSAPTTSWPSR